MSKENWWINDYEVTVLLKDKVVYQRKVRSKAPRCAVTNVLTSHYRGDMDEVKVKQLTFYTKEGK